MSQYLKDANKMERVCYNRMRAAELARDSACLLWFRARKWREIAVLLVPVRERLEIACGCSGVCRMEVARAGALHKTSTKTCFGKK